MKECQKEKEKKEEFIQEFPKLQYLSYFLNHKLWIVIYHFYTDLLIIFPPFIFNNIKIVIKVVGEEYVHIFSIYTINI